MVEQYPGDAITLDINGENAYVYGFETNYQQRWSNLPGFLKGLGLSANFTYTASQEKGLPLRTDSPALQRQTPYSWNIGPTYDTKRLSLRMGIAYNGTSIYSYYYIDPALVPGANNPDPNGLGPKGPTGDIYTYAHLQVDAQGSYHIGHGFSVMAYGLNLTNEVFGYYQGKHGIREPARVLQAHLRRRRPLYMGRQVVSTIRWNILLRSTWLAWHVLQFYSLLENPAGMLFPSAKKTRFEVPVSILPAD